MGTKVFTEDLEIAQALINRDEKVTRDFFFRQCYPLFKSIYDHYYTDCESCLEFINEMYYVLIIPGKITKRSKIESYRGESTLTNWLKSICIRYCYKRFRIKTQLPFESIESSNEEKSNGGNRNLRISGSLQPDMNNVNKNDVSTILSLMPTPRYRELIKLRYIDNMSHEDAAKTLGMTLANYYNKHKLAKEQFTKVLLKEARYE